MHYYQFNISDYASHTGHLNPTEDCAYRRMIDWLHLHEKPLPNDHMEIARLIRMREHPEVVIAVVNEFLRLGDDGYTHGRVTKGLDKYHDTKESRSKAGKASAKARARAASEQAFNTCSTGVQLTNNQEPLTNNQEPSKTTVRFSAPTVDEVRAYCQEKGHTFDPERFVNFYESKNWMVGKNKMQKWKAAAANWENSNDNNTKGNSGDGRNTGRLSGAGKTREAREAARQRESR